MWEFLAGDYPLDKDADPVDGCDVAGLKYGELADELRIRLDTYPLDVVLVVDADEDEVREMFLRLQNGTSLRAQEKRNAYPGTMRDYVRTLASHPFFESVGFSNSRYTYDLVAAQMVRLELAGGPANVKNRDLNKMYENGRDFDPNGKEAKAVTRTLDLLRLAFPEKTPELTRYNVVALYAVVAELLASYVRADFEEVLGKWFLSFEAVRRGNDELSEDEADSEWIQYKEKISHSTDSEDSIRWRMDFMLKHLFTVHSNIRLKDATRAFTSQQRLAIYRRDGGQCQLKIRCSGKSLKWDDWHCDHRVPWNKGGPTSVENGVAACSQCNLSKGDQLKSTSP